MTHTPDLRDRVPQGSGIYTVNTKIEPAIPNLMGGFYSGIITAANPNETYAGQISGAGTFEPNSYINMYAGLASAEGQFQGRITSMNFDASYYSSIYKNNCNTVQPPALVVNFYIKAK